MKGPFERYVVCKLRANKKINEFINIYNPLIFSER